MDQERLAALIRQNDRKAQEELFLAFYQRTFSTAYHLLRNREGAEDITQEAFVKAFHHLHRLREPEKFGAWLAVIASNLARNHLKRERRLVLSEELPEPASGGDLPVDGTAENAMRSLEVDRVRRALRELPPDQYQVVVLQYYHDLKLEDIAAMLRISPGTVKSRLFRARQKLARSLELFDTEDCLSRKGGGAE